MIQQESRVKVADNTGAEGTAMYSCIRRFWKRYANIGDVIVASVKRNTRRCCKKEKL